MSRIYRGRRNVQLDKIKQMQWKSVLKKERENPTKPIPVEQFTINYEGKEWVVNGKFEKYFTDYCYPDYKNREIMVVVNPIFQNKVMIGVKGEEVVNKLKSHVAGKINEGRFTDFSQTNDYRMTIGTSDIKEIDVIVDFVKEWIA